MTEVFRPKKSWHGTVPRAIDFKELVRSAPKVAAAWRKSYEDNEEFQDTVADPGSYDVDPDVVALLGDTSFDPNFVFSGITTEFLAGPAGDWAAFVDAGIAPADDCRYYDPKKNSWFSLVGEELGLPGLTPAQKKQLKAITAPVKKSNPGRMVP